MPGNERTERQKEVVRAYREWNPDEKTSEQLAQSMGISRARMYTILKKMGEPLKTNEQSVAGRHIGTGMEGEMARIALEAILDQLHDARSEADDLRKRLDEYREEFGPLGRSG